METKNTNPRDFEFRVVIIEFLIIAALFLLGAHLEWLQQR